MIAADKQATRWTHVMLMILRENHDEMTVQELATAIGVPKSSIINKMKELDLRRAAIKVKKQPKIEKSLPKPLTQKKIDQQIADHKKAEQAKVRSQHQALQAASRQREDRKVLKIKQVDYSQLRSVRIDSKTLVYVKPGDDIEAIKKKYTRTLDKFGLNKIEP